MRTDLNSGGFTLYEILFSNTIVGIKTCLLSVSLSSLLDRFVYLNTAVQFKDTLRLALNKRKFHRLKTNTGNYLSNEKTTAAIKLFCRKKCQEKSQLVPHTVLLSALSALPLEAPSFSKLRITAQKPWSVRLYVSDRLKF